VCFPGFFHQVGNFSLFDHHNRRKSFQVFSLSYAEVIQLNVDSDRTLKLNSVARAYDNPCSLGTPIGQIALLEGVTGSVRRISSGFGGFSHFVPHAKRYESIDGRCYEGTPSSISHRFLYAILLSLISFRISYRMIVKGDDHFYRLSWHVLIPHYFIGNILGFGLLLDCALYFTEPRPEGEERSNDTHSSNTVTHKLLTAPYFCNTLIAIGRAQMANILSIDQQVQIISALAGGAGIRQIERMTGVHCDTIMRLGVRVGGGGASRAPESITALCVVT
jgi:hypothetical protein